MDENKHLQRHYPRNQKIIFPLVSRHQRKSGNLILALQHRDIPAIRQALQKVTGFGAICDQTGLLDAEPTLWMNDDPKSARIQSHL